MPTRYNWVNVLQMPYSSGLTILQQLKSGVCVELTMHQWRSTHERDIKVSGFINEEVDGRSYGDVYIKLTNDSRRKLIREWSMKQSILY
jgi:hypothetical protein